jgi:hypothetical protein
LLILLLRRPSACPPTLSFNLIARIDMIKWDAKNKKYSPPARLDDLSSMTLHAQNQVRQASYPSVDSNGCVYTTAGTGRKSVTSRKLLFGKTLTDHLTTYFPQGNRTIAGPPRDRAQQYKAKKHSGQFAIFGGAVSEPAWTAETAMYAAREFEIPDGTKIIHLFPDIFDRDILGSEDAYKRPYIDAGGGAKTSILTYCPHCLSNRHIKVTGHSCHKGNIRGVADAGAEKLRM